MVDDCDKLALDNSTWRNAVHSFTRDFDQNRVVHEKLKRDIRNGLVLISLRMLLEKFF